MLAWAAWRENLREAARRCCPYRAHWDLTWSAALELFGEAQCTRMMQKVTEEDIEAVMDDYASEVISMNALRRLLEERLRLPKHSLDDQESKDEIRELCRNLGWVSDRSGSPAGPPAAAEKEKVQDIEAIMGEAGLPAGSPASSPAADDLPGASDCVPLEAHTVQQLVLRLKAMNEPVGKRTKAELVARLRPGTR